MKNDYPTNLDAIEPTPFAYMGSTSKEFGLMFITFLAENEDMWDAFSQMIGWYHKHPPMSQKPWEYKDEPHGWTQINVFEGEGYRFVSTPPINPVPLECDEDPRKLAKVVAERFAQTYEYGREKGLKPKFITDYAVHLGGMACSWKAFAYHLAKARQ